MNFKKITLSALPTLPTLARIGRATVLAALVVGGAAATGCDSEDDTQTEVSRQLDEADVALDEVLAALDGASDDAVVFDAQFEVGADAGFYEIIAVEGQDEITWEIDGRTGERVETDRRRASPEREDLARRHRHLRRRLAQAVGEAREESRDWRPLRARLRLAAGQEEDTRGRDGSDDARGRDGAENERRLEIEIEVVDRRGNTRMLRRALAAAE